MKYYTLSDCKDMCMGPDIFRCAFKTREAALEQAKKYLESIVDKPERWFFPNLSNNSYNDIKRDYDFKGVMVTEKRPVNPRIEFVENYGVKIVCEFEMKINELCYGLETKIIDGQKYERKTEKINLVRDWTLEKETRYKSFNYVTCPVVYNYSIYLEERGIDFWEDKE